MVTKKQISKSLGINSNRLVDNYKAGGQVKTNYMRYTYPPIFLFRFMLNKYPINLILKATIQEKGFAYYIVNVPYGFVLSDIL